MTTITATVLKQPHITEKATFSAENSVYVFKLDKAANKNSVEKAFKEKYKVEPVKVRIVNIPAKKVFVRGKVGQKSGYKKAYIYLKKGEKIEII
jgi:large subunit ribosomal protein L23